MKNVFVSAVNIKDGGPHIVLKNFALEIDQHLLNSNISVTYILSNEAVLNKTNAKILRYNWPNKNYFLRLYFEYIYLYFFTLTKEIDLWISLNDSTPNVSAKKKIVYCHNPSPFYLRTLNDFLKNTKFAISSFLYKYVYKINIHKNDIVIVQQSWLKKRLYDMFKHRNIIVAKPIKLSPNTQHDYIIKKNSQFTQFIYPAYPRFFKNFEVICESVQKLNNQGISNFNVILTIDGNENTYAKNIYKTFCDTNNISFIGIKPHEEIQKLMLTSDCLIFPSRLETWGLPISEAINAGIYVIASDLEYAYETVGDYPYASFFPSLDSQELSELMYTLITSTHFKKNRSIHKPTEDIYFPDYKSLVSHCLSLLNT